MLTPLLLVAARRGVMSCSNGLHSVAYVTVPSEEVAKKLAQYVVVIFFKLQFVCMHICSFSSLSVVQSETNWLLALISYHA